MRRTCNVLLLFPRARNFRRRYFILFPMWWGSPTRIRLARIQRMWDRSRTRSRIRLCIPNFKLEYLIGKYRMSHASFATFCKSKREIVDVIGSKRLCNHRLCEYYCIKFCQIKILNLISLDFWSVPIKRKWHLSEEDKTHHWKSVLRLSDCPQMQPATLIKATSSFQLVWTSWWLYMNRKSNPKLRWFWPHRWGLYKWCNVLIIKKN